MTTFTKLLPPEAAPAKPILDRAHPLVLTSAQRMSWGDAFETDAGTVTVAVEEKRPLLVNDVFVDDQGHFWVVRPAVEKVLHVTGDFRTMQEAAAALINRGVEVAEAPEGFAVLPLPNIAKMLGMIGLEVTEVEEAFEPIRIERHAHGGCGCGCGGHHHHHHDDECGCGCGGHHHHHHDEEECSCGCGGHHHHHHDEEECGCGGHHHHHHDEEECGCGCGGHHHHHHDEEECGCGCGGHHHHDEEECSCGCGGHGQEHKEGECCCEGEHHHHDGECRCGGQGHEHKDGECCCGKH